MNDFFSKLMNILIRKNVLLILTLAAIGLPALKGQEVQPDAIYLQQLKEYKLNADGSWSYHYSHKLKLLTYFSFHTLYGEDFLAYNPLYQKLTINHSSTTMADGKVVTTPSNAYNELLPSYATNAPAYNHIREMAVTHTGLERGAIEDFDYTLYSTKDFSPSMAGNDVLTMNSPVEKLTYVIQLPSNISLNYEQFNIPVKPVVSKQGNMVSYTWTLENMPAALREDFRPREAQNRPRIIFSASKNAARTLDSFLSQPAFDLKTDVNIQTAVENARKGTKGDLALMMKLQDIVANEVNFQPVPISAAAYRVRSAEETFSGNGGSEAEKSVLLAAMLKTAGFKAYPVALVPERYFDKKTFNLLLAEKFLVKAEDSRGESYLLSPLANDLQDEQFISSGKTLIALAVGKSLQTEKITAPAGELELNGNLKIGSDLSVSGTMSLSVSNRLNPYLKLSQDSSYARKLCSHFMEADEIKKFSFDRLDKDQASIRFEAEAEKKLREIAGHYFFTLPKLAAGMENLHLTELVSTRTEPMEIPFPVNESYHFTITLPEGWELISREFSETEKQDFGSMKIQISQEGRTLQVDKVIKISKVYFEPSEYPAFRTFINTWNDKKYQEAIFRIGPK